jgi:hypothetical protein
MKTKFRNKSRKRNKKRTYRKRNNKKGGNPTEVPYSSQTLKQGEKYVKNPKNDGWFKRTFNRSWASLVDPRAYKDKQTMIAEHNNNIDYEQQQIRQREIKRGNITDLTESETSEKNQWEKALWDYKEKRIQELKEELENNESYINSPEITRQENELQDDLINLNQKLEEIQNEIQDTKELIRNFQKYKKRKDTILSEITEFQNISSLQELDNKRKQEEKMNRRIKYTIRY